MSLHVIQCDLGGEYLLPWARKKLSYWHQEMLHSGQRSVFKIVQVSDGRMIYVNSELVAPGVFIDKTRVVGGDRVWVYRDANDRTFFASGKPVTLLPVPTDAPEGLTLFTPVMFENWSNFDADYMVSNKRGTYLAFDATQTDMHFVASGKYLGKDDTKKLGAGVGADTWLMARTGAYWARQHSAGTDISAPTAAAGIDVYEPDLPDAYFTTHYSWDDFFAPYVVAAGLSEWVYSGVWVLRFTGGEEGTFDLSFNARYNPPGDIADFSRDGNVGVFTWDFVTAQVVTPGPYPPGTTNIYTNFITRRRVIGVLDSPAFSSELPELAEDTTTGRPALGEFRVVSDTTADYQIYSVIAFPTNSFTYSGQNLGASDWLVSSKGHVIHVENITDYSSGGIISASVFVDGTQVYTTDAGAITLPSGGDTETWFDKHPAETADGLAFLFRVFASADSTYRYYLCKCGVVSDTGISHTSGALYVGPLLTADAEHIVYQIGSTTQVWRDGVMVWGDTDAMQFRSNRKGPIKDQDSPRVFYVAGTLGEDTTAKATISWTVNPDESRTYSVTQSPDLEPLNAGVDYDGITVIPQDSNDLYVPFSSLPK